MRALVVVALVLVTACGGPPAEVADPDDVEASQALRAPCAIEAARAVPADEDRIASAVPKNPVDGPPNYVDNHAYKQRYAVSSRARAGAGACAELVRAGLTGLRAQGRADEESVRTVLAITGMQVSFVGPPPPYPVVSASPGAAVVVRFAAMAEQGVCVFGEHSLTESVVNIDGITMEGGCFID